MRKLSLLLVLFCGACATNPYRQFFNKAPSAGPIPKLTHQEMKDPEIRQGSSPGSDVKAMMENGYDGLGWSAFSAGDISDREAKNFGAEIGADVVLTYKRHESTRTSSVPITVPNTQTSYTNVNAYSGGRSASAYGTTTTYGTQTTYVPVTVERYSYEASFWKKGKRPIFGAAVADLTPERRAEIGSNSGAQIVVLIKGSPAFRTDFLENDVIRKIGDRTIGDPGSFYESLDALKGKKVVVEFLRGSKPMKKTIQLEGI